MKRRDFVSRSALATVAGLLTNANGYSFEAPSRCPAPFPNVDGVTKYVAQFVVDTTLAQVPENVLELGKKSILDGLGLALAGSVAESGTLVLKYLQDLGLEYTGTRVVGSGMKVPARFAAFANGVSIHADDFDDTQLAAAKDRVYGLLVHPTAPVLPAVLAFAELKGASGRELMLAYHLGVEVECKVAEAISPRHYEDGFHSTGTCGPLGAAAAGGKLLGFDAKQIRRALSIAASQAAGLRENFGTMTKPFHAGHASESGIVAVDLTNLGWTAADQILEAPRGFFHAYGGSYDPAAIIDRLGKPWTFSSPGISIKPFPSGSLTHPGMTELLRVMRKEHIKAVDVERVDVGTNHNMPNALIHHRPATGLQAKFSMEFCLAVLLLYGEATLAEFRDDVVNRPEVQAMIHRVNFYVDPDAEKAGFDKMTTILRIHLKNGKTLSGRADFGKGSPADPMTYEEVADKFRGNAAFANWPKEKAETIVELVRTLERVDDARKLVALCGK
jgi:2-methylcitrate dehydratase PrpD